MAPSFTKEEFIEIYNKYHDAIVEYCERRSSDKSKATQLSEHIFMKAWEQIIGGAEVDDMHSFLFSIAEAHIKEKEHLYRDIMAFSILSSNRVMHHNFAH